MAIDPKTLVPGIYELFLTNGKSVVAAIGRSVSGNAWIAQADLMGDDSRLSPGHVTPPLLPFDWNTVRDVKLHMSCNDAWKKAPRKDDHSAVERNIVDIHDEIENRLDRIEDIVGHLNDQASRRGWPVLSWDYGSWDDE